MRLPQAFLYGLLQQEEEAAALRALAVLTELHRRNVWRDARTVNVIGRVNCRKIDVFTPLNGAVLAAQHRRNVWRDARTVNDIVQASRHAAYATTMSRERSAARQSACHAVGQAAANTAECCLQAVRLMRPV